jgi:hypothetical protein
VVDLVGLPAMPPQEALRQRARSLVDLARLLARHNRWRPPEEAFVIDPRGITFRAGPASVSGAPGQRIEIPVEVTNGSHSWLSSDYPHHPVHVSYRWLDETGARIAEGRRTGFAEPLAPGRSAQITAAVDTPADAGRYTLVLTLVQNGFAWLDDTDPGCSTRILAVIGGDPV